MHNFQRNRQPLNSHNIYGARGRRTNLGNLEVNLPHLTKNRPLPTLVGFGPKDMFGRQRVNENRNIAQENMNKLLQRIQQTQEKNNDPLLKPRGRRGHNDYRLVHMDAIPDIIEDVKRGIVYTKGELLGTGAFARVVKVTDNNGNHYAAKVISKLSMSDDKLQTKVLSEINIHRTLEHEYILKFINCFEDNRNIYMILELCENQTLGELIKRRSVLTEDEVRYYMSQIFSALRYTSDNRVLHRDLKLGNVLLDSELNCKIADFGLAALLLDDEDRRKTICGTPHYIAPEILFDKGGHDQRVDMWSAGIVMYTLLFGRHPFHHTEAKQLYHQVKRNKMGEINLYADTDDCNVSIEAKRLISALLVNDPNIRLTVVDVLHHPFFKSPTPVKIPLSALYRPPSPSDLHGTSDTTDTPPTKFEKTVSTAKDRFNSLIDRRIAPHCEIPAPRSQYPLNIAKPNTTPELPITKKRLYSAINDEYDNKEEKPSKRLQTGSIPNKIPVPRVHKPPVKEAAKKPVIDQMAENIKIWLDKYYLKDRKDRVKIEDYKTITPGWSSQNVFVQNWVDYSDKYGLAYSLTDGTVGVSFNDSTTLTTNDELQYCYRFKREDNSDVKIVYSADEIPAELKKKYGVLSKFKEYMTNNLLTHDAGEKTQDSSGIHVVKYSVFKQGISFRLSNGVVQLNLFNHHKLILYNEGRSLIYIDSNRALSHHDMAELFNSQHDDIVEAIFEFYNMLVTLYHDRKKLIKDERWKRYNHSTEVN
ncbi:kinase-like domain-containing protein [Pilobolus umbonatus]|nr:kinase-like domain-containing protein [Pilobolus umbonatus]